MHVKCGRYALLMTLLLLMGSASAASSPVEESQAEPPSIGIVDHVSGRWKRAQDRQTLIRGQLLYANQTITTGRADTGSIGIVLFAGNERWEKICSVAAPCAGSYRPSPTARSSRGFWSFLSSFWTAGRQLPPVVAASRGVGNDHATHALVAVDGPLVDLRPALASLTPGRYTLRLIPAPGGSLEGAATHEVVVTLDTSRATRIPGLTFGLYLLSVVDEAGQTVGSPALVLLGGTSDARTQTWQEAASRVADWQDVGAETKSAILAQTLYALDAGGNP